MEEMEEMREREREMEEMRGAAMACYANMSDEKKQEVFSFFRLLDKDGDGKVSIQEFIEFVKTHGDGSPEPNLFQLLDKNNDGTLDFAECITFFYMGMCEKATVKEAIKDIGQAVAEEVADEATVKEAIKDIGQAVAEEVADEVLCGVVNYVAAAVDGCSIM